MADNQNVARSQLTAFLMHTAHITAGVQQTAKLTVRTSNANALTCQQHLQEAQLYTITDLNDPLLSQQPAALSRGRCKPARSGLAGRMSGVLNCVLLWSCLCSSHLPPLQLMYTLETATPLRSHSSNNHLASCKTALPAKPEYLRMLARKPDCRERVLRTMRCADLVCPVSSFGARDRE